MKSDAGVSAFPADVMLGNRDPALGIGRTVNGVERVAFSSESCVVAGWRQMFSGAKEAYIRPAPTAGSRIDHSYSEVLAGGHRAKAHPLAAFRIVADEIFRTKSEGPRLLGLVVRLLQPQSVEDARPGGRIDAGFFAHRETASPSANQETTGFNRSASVGPGFPGGLSRSPGK
jgi:hypothetical protein